MVRTSKPARVAQALVCFALVAGLCGVGFPLGRVRGDSMGPTVHNDSVLLVRRLNWPAPPLRKGEVIVFRQGRDWLVKRIAALPGEPFPAAMDEDTGAPGE